MKASTLNFICIMFVLLDMITSPSGCHDRHDRHYRPHEGINSAAFTGSTKSVGATWAEVEGRVYLDDVPAYSSPIEFGVEYSDSTDKSMQNSVRVAASSLDKESFFIKLTGLQPSKSYAYRTYLNCTSNINYQGNIAYFHTLEADEANQE